MASGTDNPLRIDLPTGTLDVMPVPGEPTTYVVESGSLQCSVCNRVYKRWRFGFDSATGKHKLIIRPNIAHGGPCPYRGGCRGVLGMRYHRVDIATYGGHGSCGCELFQFTLEPALSKTHPSTWLEGKFRCHHLEAARSYALDLSVRHHVRTQLQPHARGRQELDGSGYSAHR